MNVTNECRFIQAQVTKCRGSEGTQPHGAMIANMYKNQVRSVADAEHQEGWELSMTTSVSELPVSSPIELETRHRISAEFLIALIIGIVAFGTYLWQLSVPSFVSFYDSGVYFAASLHFATGVIPYKDFTFVNPPGIVLLMSPLALLSRLVGSHDGFILARIATSFVTAVNAGLLAWLVRHRGRLAMVVAGCGLALLPVAFLVSSAVKIDPYSILFVLLGALIILSYDHGLGAPSTRNLILGGVLLGFAGDIKLWAVFPFIALLICVAPRIRFRAFIIVGSGAIGFIAPSLPFFLLAPRSFISEVFTVQLFQKYNPAVSQGVLWRLIDLTGFSQTSVAPTEKGAAVAFLAFLVVIVIAFWRRQDHEVVDFFLLISAVITLCALLAAPVSDTYYAYFAAPFLLGVLAVSLSRVGATLLYLIERFRSANVLRRILQWSTAAVCGALILLSALSATTTYRSFATEYGISGANLSVISTLIPEKSCVVYDFVVYGVFANRLQANRPDCPSVVDPYGMWQSAGDQLVAPPSDFVAEWETYFERAQYVVLNAPETSYIPWNAGLLAWFASNYYLIYSNEYVFIYARTAHS
jgi:hypothetical protein